MDFIDRLKPNEREYVRHHELWVKYKDTYQHPGKEVKMPDPRDFGLSEWKAINILKEINKNKDA